jgi:hypothetical protein
MTLRLVRWSVTELVVATAAVALVARFARDRPIFAGVMAAVSISGLAVSMAYRRIRLRKLGYLVRREGRDQFRYEEWADGAIRFLTIDGSLGSPHAVYIPSHDAWDRDMPSWARSRRTEIVGKLKQELGAAGYEFLELQRDA